MDKTMADYGIDVIIGPTESPVTRFASGCGEYFIMLAFRCISGAVSTSLQDFFSVPGEN